jgi:outer membrane immunogenic protein
VTHVKDSVLCAAAPNGLCGSSAHGGSSVTWSDSAILTGGTVGGGIETMFAPNWIARVEYLYAKFDNTTPAVTATTGGPFGAGNPIQPLFTFNHTLNLVRFAINYRFSP